MHEIEKKPLVSATTSRKKRKPTYYVRKDEVDTLREEMKILQARLDTLVKQQQEAEDDAFVDSVGTNLQLQFDVGVNTNRMADMQGTLSAYQASGAAFPLESFIHLTNDVEQRQQTLLSLRDAKLQEGLDYIIERTQLLDLRRPHCKSESSYTPNGDFTFSQFDVVVFPGVDSVRSVYDAIIKFLHYQEHHFSDVVSWIAIRDPDNPEQHPVLQCRMITSLPNDLAVETNGAMYFSFVEDSDRVDAPYGLIVSTTITKDDMFPDQRDRRVHLRSTGALMISRTPGEPSTPGKTDVTLTSANFSCFHLPNELVGTMEMDVPAHEFASRFAGMMFTALRERLQTA
ncbi:hypothetical protein Poli38472_012371 [Pythium oligandrum]|uniref:START domain-containing protein n=1 Tax=Pythium oligandrum TaxID=41045 RepID=A0A8K1CPR6_PYTOL|nr:hypothetical protein Poli38472_012371 [Pythium oligandrum]|eukprot:TMW67255.1 hypothetical protein Poli38472_012371 [Pythium oligandrum]